MVARKPIVINNGELEQLQAGDVLDVSHVQTRTRTNNTGGALIKFTVVYPSSGTEVSPAQANSATTKRVMGLLLEAIADTASGLVAVDGIVEGTTGEWDAVTGETGGLTPNANYYLDPTNPGQLTQTAPTTPGQWVVRVGHAYSATEFEIEIQQSIKL